MAKGIEDHVGFFAPQSKQILLASFLLSWLKRVCDSVFVAIAMMGECGQAITWREVYQCVGAAWK